MKFNRSMVAWLVLAVVALAFAPPAPAQERKPQLWFVEDNVVKPAQVAPFEAALKEFIASVWKGYDWPWAMVTYATEDLHYYLCYPMASLTELDKAFSVVSGIPAKFGEQKFDALTRKMGETTEHIRQGTITFIPELSYVPDKPRLKPEEMTYVYWGFCYVLGGKEREFEAQLKKIADLFKAKQIDSGFNTFVGGIGTDMPLYIYMESGRSAADFWPNSEKVMKLVDPEVTELWNQSLTLMRRYEFKMGTYRPDLSYTPVKK